MNFWDMKIKVKIGRNKPLKQDLIIIITVVNNKIYKQIEDFHQKETTKSFNKFSNMQ